jgi:hypothetical protein
MILGKVCWVIFDGSTSSVDITKIALAGVTSVLICLLKLVEKAAY